MKLAKFTALLSLLVLTSTPAFANTNPELLAPKPLIQISAPKPEPLTATIAKKIKGWDHLFALLRDKEGVATAALLEIFSDKRMPRAKSVYFRLDPAESKAPYNKRLTANERSNALKFYEQNWPYFRQAELQYGVPQEVILSILQIESRCGTFTGRSRVFYRLARLAGISDPNNVERNFRNTLRRNKSVQLSDVEKRAKWLEETFLPHVSAAIKVAQAKNIHPLELRGSVAGAVGLPQFLPGNYYSLGVDGDGNGSVDLSTPGDAIHSVANFLRFHGWTSLDINDEEQKKVIWHYNRSEPYIATVLRMAKQLDKKAREMHKKIEEDIIKNTKPTNG